MNQVRCFAHVINLVAKTILRQFDTTRKTSGEDSEGKKGGDGDGGGDSDSDGDGDAEALLAELVAGIDLNELDLDEEENGDALDDVVDGWVDE